MTHPWRPHGQKKNKFAERLDKIDGKQRSSYIAIMEGNLPSHQVRPANKSMFKSSLYLKDKWVAPELKGLHDIEEALEHDYISQCRKYGSAEPNSRMARFSVRLPSSPQSSKYSWIKPTSKPKELTFQARSPDTCSTATPRLDTAPLSRMDTATPGTPQPQASSDMYSPPPGATSSSSPVVPSPRHQNFMMGEDEEENEDDGLAGVRFNKHRLAEWFRMLDRQQNGMVTQREFIVHLRKNKDLLDLFYRIASAENRDEGVLQRTYSQASTRTIMTGISPLDSRNSQPKYVRDKSTLLRKSQTSPARKVVSHREINKIKEILSEVDTDGSGSMEWPEFVDFFKRAGLLLEYQTNDSLNRTELCQAAEEAEAAEEARLANRQAQAMRAPTIRDGQAHRDLQKLRSTICGGLLSEEDKNFLEGSDEDEDEDAKDEEE